MSDAAAQVIGPDGSILTEANLPPSGFIRWTRRRKAEVAIAVRDGLLSLEDACARYRLTAEELIGWQSALSRIGPKALMVRNIRTLAASPRRQ